MNKHLFIGGAVMMTALIPSASFAAHMCTMQMQVDASNNQECVNKLKARAARTDIENVIGDAGETVYFHFGDNEVAARCINTNIVSLAAYHVMGKDQACSLLDTVKNAIRDN